MTRALLPRNITTLRSVGWGVCSMLVHTLWHDVPVSRKRLVKRLFDVLLSSVLLLITLPVVALTAILIILENPGPIFSRQRRIGEFGRPFALLRFRSTFARTTPEGALAKHLSGLRVWALSSIASASTNCRNS